MYKYLDNFSIGGVSRWLYSLEDISDDELLEHHAEIFKWLDVLEFHELCRSKCRSVRDSLYQRLREIPPERIIGPLTEAAGIHVSEGDLVIEIRFPS